MIQAKQLNLSFGAQDVFKNISFLINPNQRIGLVGRNGSGKSTLLKVIAGLHPIDSGVVALSKDFTLGYLPQEVVLESDQPIV
jgi:ATP-binding cassette, subfamily F, member 3